MEEELAYYKTQYEHLEAELQDFQASSRELEAELERDIETAEKRERELQEKADALGFEVEEWKVSVYTNPVLEICYQNSPDQIQAVKRRSKQRPKHLAERNHDPAGRKSNAPVEVAGYRSRQRRLRTTGSEHNILFGGPGIEIQCSHRKGSNARRGDKSRRARAGSAPDRSAETQG